MSREALTRLQAAIVIAVIVGAGVVGVSVWWVTKPKPPPSLELEENAVRINVKVEAEGVVLHYREELFWSENRFSEIMENQNEFSSDLIQNFSGRSSIYGERDEHAVDASVEFNEAGKSTILRCDVCSAVSKNGNSYRATFKWLLVPLGLDFIDDNFEESKKGLSWEGRVSDVPTAILIELPPQNSVYAAWAHPNGHCHAHVWWEMGIEQTELGNLTRTESVVKVEAEGTVLHYRNESLWDEDQFSTILEHKTKFESNLIKQFNESLSKYGLRATSYEIEFNGSRKSTLLKCDVHSAISKSRNRYTAEFEWLLEPLGLNLYNFKESNKELFCETPVNDTPITFTLRFPASISHCYYHVWWEV